MENQEYRKNEAMSCGMYAAENQLDIRDVDAANGMEASERIEFQKYFEVGYNWYWFLRAPKIHSSQH